MKQIFVNFQPREGKPQHDFLFMDGAINFETVLAELSKKYPGARIVAFEEKGAVPDVAAPTLRREPLPKVQEESSDEPAPNKFRRKPLDTKQNTA